MPVDRTVPYFAEGEAVSAMKLNALANLAERNMRSTPVNGFVSEAAGISTFEKNGPEFWVKVLGNDGDPDHPAHSFSQVLEQDDGTFLDLEEGLTGSLTQNQLYDVNGALLPTNTIVKVVKGTAEYYLTQSGAAVAEPDTLVVYGVGPSLATPSAPAGITTDPTYSYIDSVHSAFISQNSSGPYWGAKNENFPLEETYRLGVGYTVAAPFWPPPTSGAGNSSPGDVVHYRVFDASVSGAVTQFMMIETSYQGDGVLDSTHFVQRWVSGGLTGTSEVFSVSDAGIADVTHCGGVNGLIMTNNGDYTGRNSFAASRPDISTIAVPLGTASFFLDLTMGITGYPLGLFRLNTVAGSSGFTIALAKLTSGGSNGGMTVDKYGRVIAYTAPT